MPYEVIVAFDDYIDHTVVDVSAAKNYSRVAEKYNARRMGHEMAGTSSMFLDQLPDLAVLQKELGSTKILKVNGVPLEHLVKIRFTE